VETGQVSLQNYKNSPEKSKASEVEKLNKTHCIAAGKKQKDHGAHLKLHNSLKKHTSLFLLAGACLLPPPLFHYENIC